MAEQMSEWIMNEFVNYIFYYFKFTWTNDKQMNTWMYQGITDLGTELKECVVGGTGKND